MKNIPMKIHFFWFEDTEPEITYIEKYEKMYEGFEFKIWRREDFNSETEEGDELLMEDTNSYTKYAFEQKDWRALENYFKIKVLLEEGGICVDIDMQPTWPLDLESDSDVYLAYQKMNLVSSGLMVSAPGQKLIKSVFDYYNSLINIEMCPRLDVVLTELAYSHYPTLSYKPEEQVIDDLHILSRKEARQRWFRKSDQPYFVHRKDKGNFIVSKLASYFSWFWLLSFGTDSYKNALSLRKKTLEKTTTLNRPLRTFTVTKDLKYLIRPLFDEITEAKQMVRVHLHFKNDILKETFEKMEYVQEVTFGVETTKNDYYELEPTIIGNTTPNLEEEVVIKFKKTNKRFNFETNMNIYSRLFKSGVEGLIYLEDKLVEEKEVVEETQNEEE